MVVIVPLVVVGLSCSKSDVQPCTTAYDITMIYANDKTTYVRSDTTWQGSSCDVKDWSEHWVHMCINGMPSYWEKMVVVTDKR